MTFECAAKYGNVRCPDKTPGDTAYLGFIQLCAAHQEVFELAETTKTIREEVTNASVKRGPFGDLAERFAAASKIPQLPKARPASTVYYMRNKGYCKIGHSIHPERRLMYIRSNDGTLHPDGMQLHLTTIIATEPGGYLREQELHAKFSHLRHTGEWFTETPELTAHIEAVTAAARHLTTV